MYSWKAIRLTCTILLFLPLAHLAYLMSRDALELMDNSPQAFQRELDDYIAADTRITLPKNPVVVIGGRRVRLWPDLERALAPHPVLMRGLGDAIVEDLTFNYPRLVGYYQPLAVVLLTGNSEFIMRDNKSGEELAQAVKELVELDADHGVTRHFYIFTPLKTPLRRSDDAAIELASALLADMAEKDQRVVILDANSVLAGPDGLPDPAYFRSDGLQVSEHGYVRLTALLQNRIATDLPLPTNKLAGP